jgi:hypothetical protein
METACSSEMSEHPYYPSFGQHIPGKLGNLNHDTEPGIVVTF